MESDNDIRPEARIVLTTFVGSKETRPRLVGRLRRIAREIHPQLPGLVSSTLLLNEPRTRVVEQVEWASHDAHAQAIENPALKKAFEELKPLITRYEQHIYRRATSADVKGPYGADPDE